MQRGTAAPAFHRESIMPRKRVKKLWPIALSVDGCAVAIQCSPALLRRAIDAGQLECFENPETGHKRVLVESLTEYVRTYWKPATHRSEQS
jgi:hypothetical protein